MVDAGGDGCLAKSKLVGLLFESWDDLDRVLAGLTPDEAMSNLDGGSAPAWTLAHLTQVVDAWINVRFQKRAPHPLIGQARFGIGSNGVADDWDAIRTGVAEVRQAARAYLEDLDDDDLETTVAYDGSLSHLRGRHVSLRYFLYRIVAHNYFHIGEIAAKRNRLGHDVGDYPGPLIACV